MKRKTTIVLSFLILISTISLFAQNGAETTFNHAKLMRENASNIGLDKIPANNSKFTGDYANAPDLNWAMQFGGSAFDQIKSVVSDNMGNVYVTGSFYEKLSLSSTNYLSTGIREAFVAKFSNTGSLIWLTQIPASASEQTAANDICMDASGNLFITGYYTGAITLGSSTLPNMNNYSMFYAKLNAQGVVQNGAYHSSVTNEIGMYIDTDISGNIYISVTIPASTSSIHPSFFVKYNSSNSQIYANQYEVGFNDFVIEGNSIYYSGVINQGDNGVIDGNVTLPQPMLYNDVFVLKSDLAANFDWGFIAGHKNNGDSRNDRISYSNDNIYLMGNFRNSIAFGTDTVQAQGGAFITKIDTLGNAQWLQTHIASSEDIAITNDNNGVVYASQGDYLGKYSSTGTLLNSYTLNKVPSALNYTDANKLVSVGAVNGNNFVVQYTNTAIDWTAQFGGTSAKAEVYALRTDNDFSAYTYGYSSNIGLFFSKQNWDGTLEWTKQFNDVPQGRSVGNLLMVDAANQFVYITGFFEDSLVIPNQTTLLAATDGSTFIIKYDLSGNFIWSKKEDFEGFGYCLATDYSGNIVLSGTFDDTISIGGTTLITAGLADCFIVKYNSSSAMQWAKRAGGESIEYVGLVSVDGDDNIYITGEFTSENVTIDTYSFTMLAGEGNVLFSKMSPSGNVLWAKSFGDSEHAWHDDITWPTGIMTDENGNTYIKGNLSYKGKFDNIVLTNPNSYFNKFITRVDSSGTVLWAKSITQPVQVHQFDYNQFDVDNEGNVYFGMQVKNIINFGTDFQYTPASTSDLMVAKYSKMGNLEWVKTIESAANSYTWISSVAVYDTSNVFVGGMYRGSLSIDGGSMTSRINHGFISMFGADKTIGFNEVYNVNKHQLKAYPNPTKNIISFEGKVNLDGAQISIYSVEGKLIKNQAIDNTSSIDVKGFPKGVYFIKVYTKDGQVYSESFIKN